MAAAKALAIEDILDNIFAHVEHPSSLTACIRVNNLWHDVAARYLWHGEPSGSEPSKWSVAIYEGAIFSLHRLHSQPERFKANVKNTKHLLLLYKRDIEGNPSDAGHNIGKRKEAASFWATRPFEATRLQYLAINAPSDTSGPELSQAIMPSLRTLVLVNCPMDEKWLTTLIVGDLH